MAFPKSPESFRDQYAKLAPKFLEITHDVLFGDVWERPGLSKRDRSFATITTLIALNRVEQLSHHMGLALDNGFTPDEIVELLTHLAFYSGWPNSMTALRIAKELFEAELRTVGSAGPWSRAKTPPAYGALSTLGLRSAAR
jgi:4-carboxymuconolactone decarboxylase